MVLVALAGIVAAVGLGALILIATNAGGGSSGGDDQFDLLRVDNLLSRQERDGIPTCLPDLASGDRPVCIWHEGDDPDAGWTAYDGQVGGCGFTFDVDAQALTGCGEPYPFNGEGLPQYDVTVDDERLVVDLGG